MLGAEMGWLAGVGVALLLESPLPNPHCVGRSVEEAGRGRGPEDPSSVPAQQFFSPGPFLPATASPSLAPTPLHQPSTLPHPILRVISAKSLPLSEPQFPFPQSDKVRVASRGFHGTCQAALGCTRPSGAQPPELL